MQLERTEQRNIPRVGLAAVPHAKASGHALVKGTRSGQTLEGTLRQVNVVVLATSALINNTDTNAARDLGIAETDKVTARRTMFPSLQNSTNVVGVLGIPITIATGRVLQVMRRVPSNLNAIRPELVLLIRTVGEKFLLGLQVALVHTEARLATDVKRTLLLLVILELIVTNLRVDENHLLTVIIEELSQHGQLQRKRPMPEGRREQTARNETLLLDI